MRLNIGLAGLLAATILFVSSDVFARGLGGGGGGGARPGGGGGGARPGGGGGGGGAHFGGGGGSGAARPSFSGGAGRPNLGGGGGGGGGGARPNLGNIPNHTPSFSNPAGGASSRPNLGEGNRPNFGSGDGLAGGNRPGIGGGNRPNIGSGDRPNFAGTDRPSTRPALDRPNLGGGNRPEIGGGNRPEIGGGNRPNIGGGNRPSTLPADRPNIAGGNRPNINGGIGNNTNIGHIGNNNFNNFNNIHNNINIATNRPYYNNWQHGNWNGNWAHPGGGGYWNGYAHGYANGYARGYWNGGWGGYWHGGWGGYGYWGRPWYASPIAWGLGSWAVGSIIYNSGYAVYNNPYYAGSGTSAYYDYSQPITVINQGDNAPQTVADGGPVTDASSAAPGPTPAPPPEVQEGTSHMDSARDAFKKGDYITALTEVDLAIQSLPRDAALHEFRALVFFATKDYPQAAATLYAVLSAGPGWDWTTLSGMYASTSTYTDQLRELEQYVKENPTAADARFVLAYQYLTCGHNDAAVKQYQEVIKLQPGNQLAAQLLQMLGSDSTATDLPSPEPASDDIKPVAPPPIDAAKLVGKWTAKRPDGPTFTLNVTQDSKFTWTYDQGNKHEQFGGKYSVDGAILVLERTDGSQMPGLITMAADGFNFKLYGGPPDDSGLDFKK